MKRSLWFTLVLALALGASSLAAVPAAACDDEGCTPGYWKQGHHLDSWPATGYAPGDDFEAVFGVDWFTPDITLLDALKLKGNKLGIERLAAHAVAGLLGASHPDVAYAYSESEIIAMVQAGGKANKDLLDDANNGDGGCPLN